MKERIILLHEYLVDLVSGDTLTDEEEDRALNCIGDCEMILFYHRWPAGLLTS